MNEKIRDKFFILVVVGLVALGGIALFAGDAAPQVEHQNPVVFPVNEDNTPAMTTDKGEVIVPSTIISKRGSAWTYTNNDLGFEFSYPENYETLENTEGGYLVHLIPSGESDSEANWINSMRVTYKKYSSSSGFESYKDYRDYLINDYVLNLVRSTFGPAGAIEEHERLKPGYGTWEEEINGHPVIIHGRTFYGSIGRVSEMFVWLNDNKTLEFQTEMPEDLAIAIFRSFNRTQPGEKVLQLN